MHPLQAHPVEFCLDGIGQGLHRGLDSVVELQSAGMSVQRRNDHVVMRFQVGQHRRPCPPDPADAVQQQQRFPGAAAVQGRQVQRWRNVTSTHLVRDASALDFVWVLV